MRRTNGPILKYVSTKEELEQIVKENTPKESTLIEKAEGLNELRNVDKYLEILDEPECTEEHIDTILEKVNISEVLTENDKAEIYITIVDNENASSEIFEKITNSTDNDVVMLGVINNDNCDIETIENILNKTDDAFVESIAINKIDELIDSDMEILSNEIIVF